MRETRLFRIAAYSAILLTVVALWVDLAAWQEMQVGDSEYWRFARTVVCGLAALNVVSNSVREKRKWLLPLALALAIVADYFLILNANLVLGIGVFAVMQLVLIIRHLIGAELGKLRHRKVIIALLLGITVLAVGNVLLWPTLASKGLAIPVLVYSALLIASTLAAYSTRLTRSLSQPHANWAFWGMLLFVLCDITVGVGAAFGHTSEGQLVRSLTGLFYTPSLLLLVRSAIN